MYGAEVPGLADAHVYGNQARPLTEIARNQSLAGGRSQVKVSKRCADNVWGRVVAIDTRRRKRGTFGKQPIAVRVLAGNDVEGRAGTHNDKRIQAHLLPGQVDRSRESETMPHIKQRSAKLSGQIIGIGREESAALSISIVSRFAKRIAREECQSP